MGYSYYKIGKMEENGQYSSRLAGNQDILF